MLLHGWMDVSASFQFLVDALSDDWHVLAPDWRGFGLSEWPQDGYWFADYVADLDGAGARAGAGRDASTSPATASAATSRCCTRACGRRGCAMSCRSTASAFPARDRRARRRSSRRGSTRSRIRRRSRRTATSPPWPIACRRTTAGCRATRRSSWPRTGAKTLPDGTRAAARRSAPQAAVPERVPAGGNLRDLAADHRARAVGRGGRFQHSALARRRRRSDGRDRARGWRTFPARTLVTIADAGHMLHHDQPEAVARALESFLA